MLPLNVVLKKDTYHLLSSDDILCSLHHISWNVLRFLIFEISSQGGFSSLDVTAIQRALRQQQQVPFHNENMTRCIVTISTMSVVQTQ